MLKIITLVTKFILVALAAILFSSCNQIGNWNSIEGSGNITTEIRKIDGNFTSVEVNNSIDLIIEQSKITEITVEADDNLQEHITTTIENGTLIISWNENSSMDSNAIKVRVKMPVIEELEATSNSNISSKNTLTGENIRLHSSSGATINLNLEAEIVNCDSSSGSTMVVSGKALKISTIASSGSQITAVQLLANEVNADVSSGASISVHPIVNLVAEASSGGSITYDIQPRKTKKFVSSGGTITKS
ncbi:Putative auto-transporter adhesin, head GIN domain [Flavobacterium segetis]|uniref:Putative auto-transporter adhesin, head GIN domain n=1 Tax=Flavobacterium segetis TaxID=271157 RepID=A0A1M5EJK3_9FLAO|nr:head GIN domain-containing protein [Flavobacterium segetis]SHF79387.1 Putative auto-transporter adhesin, head GIN domain [Flavobacterium segetis]